MSGVKYTYYFNIAFSSKAEAKTEPTEEKMETDDATNAPSTAIVSDDKKIDDLSAEEKVQQNTIEKLTTILSGEKSIYCHLQFLIRNDKTDMLILKQTLINKPDPPPLIPSPPKVCAGLKKASL